MGTPCAEKEIAMAKTSRANRKRIADLKSQARAQRLLSAKKKGERLIPDSVLKRLAALNLPPNEWVYQVCLRELLRSM